MRTTPSIGSVVPVWAAISSSAGSDMDVVLLVSCDLLFDNLVGGLSVQKWCKWRDFVGGALDADHGRTVDVQRARSQRCGQSVGVG